MLVLFAAVWWLAARCRTVFLDGLFDWFDQVAGDIWKQITTFVRSAFNAAWDIINNSLSVIWETISFYATQTVDLFTQAVNLAWSLLGEAEAFASSLVDGVWNAAWSWVQGVWGWIYSTGAWLVDAVNGFYAWIQTVPAFVWGYALAAADTFYRATIAPLLHLIADAANFAISTLSGLYCGLVDLVNLVISTVSGVVAWISNVGTRIASLVLGAEKFLEWVITHPFSWFTDLWGHVADRAPEVIMAAVLRAIGSEGDKAEAWLARWLEQ